MSHSGNLRQPSPEEVRVMHVVLSLEPGGMENGVVNMANALDGRGFDIGVACLCQPGEFTQRLRFPEKVRCLEKGAGFSLGTARSLGRLFQEARVQVAHTHNLGPLIYTVLALAMSPGLWGRVTILHGEHAELNETERSGKRLLQRKLFYRACRIVHTVSHSLKADLSAFGLPAERIAVAVNGVDTERFQPLPRGPARAGALAGIGLGALADLQPEPFLIGMVGRFGQYKRHEMLIQAFENLAARWPEAHLILVGDKGPRREAVHAQVAASPWRDRIHLAGFQQDVLPYYQCFDLLAVPSVNEGLSNAVLEAMATGVPILANNACGNREVLEDGSEGFVRDLGSREKLVAELEALLAARESLPAVGAAARARALREFSILGMADRYADLYRQCAKC